MNPLQKWKEEGVLGFHAAQETLEKVSEKKSELDEKKGKTLTEISEIVQTLMQTINVLISLNISGKEGKTCSDYPRAASASSKCPRFRIGTCRQEKSL